MLSFNDFTQEFISGCRNHLRGSPAEDAMIEQCSVVKPQLGELTALRFTKPGSNISPTIYADEMYELYKAGMPLHKISEDAANVICSSLEMTPDFSERDFDLRNSAGELKVRLLHRSRNRELLENTACLDVGSGFVLIADLIKGDFRALISKDLIRESGMTTGELFDIALRNSLNEVPILGELADMLYGPPSARNLLDPGSDRKIEADSSAYVLTNYSSYWGAAALFYPGVMQKLSGLMGDFYILPSSVHELLIVPFSADCDPANLAAMIREANRTVVEERDILADDLYACISGEITRVSYGGVIPKEEKKIC